MERMERDRIIYVLGVFALYIILIYSIVYLHEATHKGIFTDYGIESRIVMTLTKAYVEPTSYPNITEERFNDMNFLHGLNEIAVFIIFSIVLISLILKVIT